MIPQVETRMEAEVPREAAQPEPSAEEVERKRKREERWADFEF